MPRTTQSSAERVDVYQEVTDRIVAALETGTVPWRQPWKNAASSHFNPVTRTVYRGINPFLLELTAMQAGYSDPRWITFKGAKTLGGQVRKGERSTLVIFWKRILAKDEATGEKKVIPILRHYRVFNVAQCDDLALAPLDATETMHEPIDAAQAIIDRYLLEGPAFATGGNRAFYAPAMDAVQVPPLAQFPHAEHYYSTCFHELAHSTGHRSRLARAEVTTPNRFGSEPYGREELTAELTAAMLNGIAGIAPATEKESASYLASWLRTLKEDPKAVVLAGGRAQRAADHIRGIVFATDAGEAPKVTAETVAEPQAQLAFAA